MSPLWTQGLKAQSCVGMEEARVHSQSRARKHNENPARGRLSVKGGLGSWARHSDTATDQAPLVSHQQGTKRESPPTALQAVRQCLRPRAVLAVSGTHITPA